MHTVNSLSPANRSTQGLLRFITAGSVDDGKSTLIGRLLFDSKGIFLDQLDAIARAKHARSIGDNLDLSLLTDGLETEREQGITIDVAYRYFSTPKRKFIIADTPGHEQYTRNMITGASTAHSVIILIDVSKIKFSKDGSVELFTQTKRHSTISHLLRIPHVIVALNKMDLIDYDQSIYNRIVHTYQKFAQQLGFPQIHFMPLSALTGENVVVPSKKMLWYRGPTLINLLESLEISNTCAEQPFRFPVQLVARHDGHAEKDFRGYMGRIEAGTVRKGDQLIVQPGAQNATVKDILVFEGSVTSAIAGQSVTLLLDQQCDISRGSMLVSKENPPILLQTLQADLCWLSEEVFNFKRKYWLKHGTQKTVAHITQIDALFDMDTQQQRSSATLVLNDIARVSIRLQQPITADPYQMIRATGAFILIDESTHQTVAAGMIGAPHTRLSPHA